MQINVYIINGSIFPESKELYYFPATVQPKSIYERRDRIKNKISNGY